MGLWKGKKGSSVFYSIWNSNNKEKQGIREYRAEVKNPQSDGQADQRARLLPAQRIKGSLRDIVSRSFQGIPYGSKSRLEFLREAMRLKTGYPFVTKGYQEPVPGKYIISKGSLGSIEGTPGTNNYEFPIITNLSGINEDTEISALTADLISANSNLLEGDQITFVGCYCSLPDAVDVSTYQWFYWSFNLDSANTSTLGEIPGFYGVQIGASSNNYLSILKANTRSGKICAAAMIISRLGEDGTYLRSTSRIAVGDEMAPFFSPSQAVVTRASYQTQTTQNSTDWPVEDDTRGGGGSSLTDGLYTLSGLTGNKATLNGKKCKVRINTLTSAPTAVYVLSGEFEGGLVGEDGGELAYQSGENYSFLTKADVPALASLPSVVYG